MQTSSHNSGVTTKFQTMEDLLNAVSVFAGNQGLIRLTITWDSGNQKTEYPVQECVITDHPIASIEEIKLKPEPKKRGRPKKQTALETDDDADYKNQLNQNTKPGDGGDFENTSGSYE